MKPLTVICGMNTELQHQTMRALSECPEVNMPNQAVTDLAALEGYADAELYPYVSNDNVHNLRKSIKIKQALIIVDGLEYQLHPVYQVKIAKYVTLAVGAGFKIVVHTMSPYIVEALQRYMEKANLEDSLTLYHCAADGILNDVSADPDVIYSEFSDALTPIIFE